MLPLKHYAPRLDVNTCSCYIYNTYLNLAPFNTVECVSLMMIV